MLTNSKSHFPIGLDISDLSLKVIQLNKTRDKIKIQAIGSKKVPAGFIVNGEIKDFKQVGKIILELLNKPNFGSITSKEVITCLPETRTFVKLIKVDKSPNPIHKIIVSEIENHIPMDIKEIYFDWQIISENSDFYEVLIGASPKLIVDQYTRLLDEIGLTALALEIEPISICRSILKEEAPIFKNKPAMNYCIFDLGAIRSSLIIYCKNTILFTVSLPIAGDEISNIIAEELQISYDQANMAKKLCGLNKDSDCNYIYKIIKEPIDILLDKVKDAIDFYNNNYPEYGPLNQIYLSGGLANLKNIDIAINNATGIPVEIGDSLTHISVSPQETEEITKQNKFPQIKIFTHNDTNNRNARIDPDFATAIGLGLRGIFAD